MAILNLVIVGVCAIFIPRMLGLVTPSSSILTVALWGAVFGAVGGLISGIIAKLLGKDK